MNATIFRLSASLCLVSVIPGWCWGQTFSSYADGKQFEVIVDNVKVAKAPQWKADEENPPLSPRRASKLANAVREKLVKDDDRWKWQLDCITLVPANERPGSCFWLVNYRAEFLKGDFVGIPPSLRLAVLMDGTVPEPTVKKRKWKQDKLRHPAEYEEELSRYQRIFMSEGYTFDINSVDFSTTAISAPNGHTWELPFIDWDKPPVSSIRARNPPKK